MRITRVYTRTGDEGQTRLVGGQVVAKDHVRIAAYGTVDELNAILGIARVMNGQSHAEPAVIARIDAMLHRVQNDCFNVGSDLATRREDRWPGMYRVGADDVKRLEEWIDALNDDVGPLREFILPGGGPVGAFLHQARTVCRRAEREVVRLLREEPEAGAGPMTYLNRLSDFLFVLGRWAAKHLGEPELLWERPAPATPAGEAS
ncbi:MAG: cob(I)yrinic acid a,c-diamide adenosyltransferase [Deltaproteobacteria bacterium]|nr:cob(I)yrinic acid a,c-diamide adenosyltransferase [Deltaproteobacteria bacterium]